MAGRTTYRTKHQEQILDYLKSSRGQHHTAAQIKEHFDAEHQSIGTATIYRQLERFVEEGMVRKYLLETGDSACYEYVDAKLECASHFHCKCEQCGRLIHMDCHELQDIREHLLEHHGFAWNAGKTVFYGICDQCREN